MGQTFNPGAWDTEAFLVELLDTLTTSRAKKESDIRSQV
jgi:hypothetical protein